MLQHVTRFDRGCRIDSDVSFVDVSNDAVFVDDERGAISKALLLVEDAVVFDDRTFEIAEERKCNPKLLCKFAVGGNTVYTHAENLGVV